MAIKELLQSVEAPLLADYSFWMKMEQWNYREAVLLSLGLDPRKFDLDELPRYLPTRELASNAGERIQLIRRTVFTSTARLLPDDSPEAFVIWFRERDLETPEVLDKLYPDCESAPSPPSSTGCSCLALKKLCGGLLACLAQTNPRKFIVNGKINKSSFLRDFQALTADSSDHQWQGIKASKARQLLALSEAELGQEGLGEIVDLVNQRTEEIHE